MKYFLDTEFIERGHEHPIELISLALVAADGREIYAVLRDGWNVAHASEWVIANVLPQLGDGPRVTRAEIAQQILTFVGDDQRPEFVGYFADYDWVIFCQLFGTMMDLPERFPMWCWDLRQKVFEVKKTLELLELPKQTGVEHNALEDARWIRDCFRWLDGLVAVG